MRSTEWCAVATSKLFGFAGFSKSFSDMAQNITSATYKKMRGWE